LQGHSGWGGSLAFALRFVLRWGGDSQLLDAQGNKRQAWRIAMGKRGWSQRTIWDSRRGQGVGSRVLALPVRHPDHPERLLWLVVCRSKGRTPWYRLPADPISTDVDAWDVVFAYARSVHIEQTWRYDKSELAFQSPRVWSWEVRMKL
jgi:hypothetical protein